MEQNKCYATPRHHSNPHYLTTYPTIHSTHHNHHPTPTTSISHPSLPPPTIHLSPTRSSTIPITNPTAPITHPTHHSFTPHTHLAKPPNTHHVHFLFVPPPARRLPWSCTTLPPPRCLPLSSPGLHSLVTRLAFESH